MDVITSIIDLFEFKTWIFIIIGFILFLFLLSAAPSNSKPTEEKEKCEICSDNEVIIYFKDKNRDIRSKADFCPKCGRELYKKQANGQ